VKHPWLEFDAEQAGSVTTGFLEDYLDEAGADRWVVGVSGGLDSATATMLAVDAVGADRVEAVFLPGPTTQSASRQAARALADAAGIGLGQVSIEAATEQLEDALPVDASTSTRGNLQARLRMAVTYAVANERDGLVLGTGNKSELLTGYFTKHGDGGVDALPLGDLYKTQVRALARELCVPEVVLEREPTAGLWEGQTDEDELGLPYEVLDVVLAGIERQFADAKIADAAEAPVEEVQRVRGLEQASRHKRNPPPVPKLAWRTVGVDWRASTS